MFITEVPITNLFARGGGVKGELCQKLAVHSVKVCVFITAVPMCVFITAVPITVPVTKLFARWFWCVNFL